MRLICLSGPEAASERRRDEQTGDLWVEALIRWKYMVEQEQEAAA